MRLPLCGRYQNRLSLESLLESLGLDLEFYNELLKQKIKRENIAPTDLIINISSSDKKPGIELSKWGIKFKSDSPLIFNSRIETIKEKTYWNNLFNKNKCLVPMTGFYEWKKFGKQKIPYNISLKDNELFFVPALAANINNHKCISLVTTEPNNFMKDIHHRMPVILLKDEINDFFMNDIEKNISSCKPLDDSIAMEMEEANI